MSEGGDAGAPTTIETDVVVVGAGPGGCVLAYLLARSGVETVLLERHGEMAREFRGYFYQPSVVRLFDEMGLLSDVLALDPVTVRRPTVIVDGREFDVFDLGELPPPYDYGLFMEQPPLLRLLVDRADDLESFAYRDRTPAEALLTEDGQVVGVRATDRDADGTLEIGSRLVVGADGRYSTVRTAAGIDPGLLDSSLELLWFKLPGHVVDGAAQGRFGSGGVLLYFGIGEEEARLGWFIEAGSYPALRDAGIEQFHEQVLSVDPSLAGVLETHLTSFDDCSLLHIAPGMSEEWVRDGLLLLGDAAHVASPIGGQGNGLAVQDAVVAHEVVVDALADQTDGRVVGEGQLRPYVARRRPFVSEVVSIQRRAERALTSLVRWGVRVPDPPRGLLLAAAVAIGRRSPTAERFRDVLARGPADLAVDTDAFVDRDV